MKEVKEHIFTAEQEKIYQQVKALRPHFKVNIPKEDEFIMLMLLAANDEAFPLDTIFKMYSRERVLEARRRSMASFRKRAINAFEIENDRL